MKKIIPFNNILTFDTDISEITAISLEHEINIDEDLISGVFHITGEYKMTDASLERMSFNFDLPFDIATNNEYKSESIYTDIDDFRYELIDRNKLKVNIDLYLDGEIIEIEKKEDREEIKVEPIPIEINKEVNLFEDMLSTPKEEETKENINTNQNINIFQGFNEEEKYVTYRVYRVESNDTIDNILKKYNISKEELSKYNIIENIKQGDKLIIPSND